MNNYDYNFNGGIIERTNELKSKFGLKMNNLKWLFYFLICFNLFQIVFFMGNSFFSIIIVIYIFYISHFALYAIMNDEELNFEFDHMILSKQLKSLSKNILVILIFYILDISVGLVFMRDYFLNLFHSYDVYEYYFSVFSTYLSIFRIAYLTYLYFYVNYLSQRD
jgi:hypothetical protein